MKLDLTQYKILLNKIPKIEQIINNKTLSFSDKESLDTILQHYSNNCNMENKISLRNKYKLLRNDISTTRLKSASDNIFNKIISSTTYKKSSVIFCFISFEQEVDTYKLLNHILDNKKTLCIPLIHNNEMKSIRINNLNDLKKNKYGILEPKFSNEISKNNIDLTITPALTFNTLGYRIGYGGGFYDKFLLDYPGVSFGVILEEFLSSQVIPDTFDQPVDRLFIG